ncbi:MAG: hypothetical protein K1X56_08860 [Flavobacteriales bacterium]|nr:hypothetical protein [Flavobacteriales bacterium]
MDKLATPVLISKESVAGLRFPAEAISRSREEQKILMDKLKDATTLGNIEHNKCRIIFSDDEGLKMVETTIWATGEKNIVLKHGMTIPIHRIVDVNIYAG